MYRMFIVAIAILASTGGAWWLSNVRSHAASQSAAGADFGEAFADQWRDGRAELAGYDLTYPRYGQNRKGTAVAIFVTEPLSKADRIKSEMPGRPADDAQEVIKLNLVEDFQTGLYDYNMMSSVFAWTAPMLGRPAGSLAKVSFSSQEWCGHVYHQVLFDADAVRESWHSYFDGEGDGAGTLAHPPMSLAEDALLLWARGLSSPALTPGQSMKVSLLRSLAVARLAHVPVEWDEATLSCETDSSVIEVPAGQFEVRTMRVNIASAKTKRSWGGQAITLPGRQWTIHVEEAPPHRIVQWLRSDGYEAKLTGSARLAYWQLNAQGKESMLKEIGLTPRAARMP